MSSQQKSNTIAVTRAEDQDSFTNNRDIRPEERWHTTLANLAVKYRNQASELSEKMDRAGYGARKKHIIFGLTPVVVSVLVSCIAALWAHEDNRFVVVPLSGIGAIFSAVHTFFNMGGRAESFWRYAALYGSVVAMVDTEISRDPDYRMPPDAFFATLRSEMCHLNGTAPQLPGKGCCGCTKYPGKQPLPQPLEHGSATYAV